MSFLEEINIDESYEKNIIRFKKSLTIISVVSVLVVIAMLLYNLYQNKVTAKSIKATTDLVSAMLLNDYKAIDSVSKIVDNANEKSKIGAIEIADLQIALKDANQKEYVQAVEKLVKIEKNKDYNDVTRYFARYLLCSIILDNKEELGNKNIFDGKNGWSDLDIKIEEYFGYFDSELIPFFTSSLTLKAIWLYKKGNVKEAKESLELIINSKTSKMLKSNAKQILSNIEIETKNQKK
jgi:predicted negative regulator of RcsB-dependent stress response